jgi:hypothetical protein
MILPKAKDRVFTKSDIYLGSVLYVPKHIRGTVIKVDNIIEVILDNNRQYICNIYQFDLYFSIIPKIEL